ncbi:MAG TPA: SH3 domain-containing protein [Aggregatilineaceae bacterium]|nr:SH3 domain-containing protein [Aggregatilineaceae bacterium]
MQNGTVCAGTNGVTIQTVGGQQVAQAGGAVQVRSVSQIDALAGDEWPLVMLHLPDAVNSQNYATLLVLGNATLTFAENANGMVFDLKTGVSPLPCADLPQPGVLVQSAANSLTLLRVNGVDVAVNGMAIITAPENQGVTISSLSREAILSQSGTVIFAGDQSTVTGDVASEVVFYDGSALKNVPVEILPVIELVALPGNGTVLQDVSLYLRPAEESYTSATAQAGLPVNLFGQDSTGQWVYVRTYDSLMGWIPRNYLDLKTDGDMPVLAEPPTLPARPFGPIQGRGYLNAEQNNLRSGPGQDYEIVVRLPVNTEVLVFGRNPDSRWLLVETLDGTRAWLSADLLSPSTQFDIDLLPLPPEFVE